LHISSALVAAAAGGR